MTVQEIVEKIFNGKETLAKADVLAGFENAGAKLADLAEGKYVGVDKHAAELREKETAIRSEYERKLAEAAAELKRFDGIDPDNARKLPEEIAALKKTSAVREALIGRRVRDITSAMPHIDLSKVEFDDEKKEFTGLTEQLDALVQDKSFLFDNGTPAGQKSSGTKTTGTANPDGAGELDENKMRAAMGLQPKK